MQWNRCIDRKKKTPKEITGGKKNMNDIHCYKFHVDLIDLKQY